MPKKNIIADLFIIINELVEEPFLYPFSTDFFWHKARSYRLEYNISPKSNTSNVFNDCIRSHCYARGDIYGLFTTPSIKELKKLCSSASATMEMALVSSVSLFILISISFLVEELRKKTSDKKEKERKKKDTTI